MSLAAMTDKKRLIITGVQQRMGIFLQACLVILWVLLFGRMLCRTKKREVSSTCFKDHKDVISPSRHRFEWVFCWWFICLWGKRFLEGSAESSITVQGVAKTHFLSDGGACFPYCWSSCNTPWKGGGVQRTSVPPLSKISISLLTTIGLVSCCETVPL